MGTKNRADFDAELPLNVEPRQNPSTQLVADLWRFGVHQAKVTKTPAGHVLRHQFHDPIKGAWSGPHALSRSQVSVSQ